MTELSFWDELSL